MIISHIVAVSENQVIGSGTDMLWHLPKDMRFFMEKTSGHHVLMGRKTFESLPPKFRPLPNRTNIIITRKADFHPENTFVFDQIDSGIKFAKEQAETELFIIGGGEIYRQTLYLADRIYLTRVHAQFQGEVTYPELEDGQWTKTAENPVEADDKHAYPFTFLTYDKKH
jgi:dihydrofolate reductase